MSLNLLGFLYLGKEGTSKQCNKIRAKFLSPLFVLEAPLSQTKILILTVCML